MVRTQKPTEGLPLKALEPPEAAGRDGTARSPASMPLEALQRSVQRPEERRALLALAEESTRAL